MQIRRMQPVICRSLMILTMKKQNDKLLLPKLRLQLWLLLETHPLLPRHWRGPQLRVILRLLRRRHRSWPLQRVGLQQLVLQLHCSTTHLLDHQIQHCRHLPHRHYQATRTIPACSTLTNQINAKRALHPSCRLIKNLLRALHPLRWIRATMTSVVALMTMLHNGLTMPFLRSICHSRGGQDSSLLIQ